MASILFFTIGKRRSEEARTVDYSTFPMDKETRCRYFSLTLSLSHKGNGGKLAHPSTSLRYAQGERMRKNEGQFPLMLSVGAERRSRSTRLILNFIPLPAREEGT